MTTARCITKRMEETGRVRGKQSIYAVVSDDHNVLCLTEEMIDTWWHELTPGDKADLYERHLEGYAAEPQPRALDKLLAKRPELMTSCKAAAAFEVSPSAILAMDSVVAEFESLKAVAL